VVVGRVGVLPRRALALVLRRGLRGQRPRGGHERAGLLLLLLLLLLPAGLLPRLVLLVLLLLLLLVLRPGRLPLLRRPSAVGGLRRREGSAGRGF
jgi:hypothetical protein